MTAEDTFNALKRIPFNDIPNVQSVISVIKNPGAYRMLDISTQPETVESIFDTPENIQFRNRMLQGTGWSDEEFIKELNKRIKE